MNKGCASDAPNDQTGLVGPKRGGERIAGVADEAGERHGRKIAGEGDADLRIGLRASSPPPPRRRACAPTAKMADRPGPKERVVDKAPVRDRKAGGRPAHQDRDRMFALRPRHAGRDERRLSVEQLSLGGDDVGLGGGPGVILVLRDRHRTLVFDDGPRQQVLERIRPPSASHRRAPASIARRAWRWRDWRRLLARPPAAPRSRAGPDPRRRASMIPEASAVRFVCERRRARRRAGAVDGRKEPGARLVDERQRLRDNWPRPP